MIRKEFWARPLFILGAEDVRSGTDYNGRDFGYDAIDMTLVEDVYSFTHL